MATTSQRVFAVVIAAVFGLSAIGFSVLVVMDMQQSRKEQDLQKQLTQAQQQAQANKQSACQGGEGEALAAPEAFRPEGDVTELKTEDLEPGTGAEAKAGDCLVVKYFGSLASDGKMFDENFTKPTTLDFVLGSGGVIKGWDEGLVGMKVGGTRRLVIPAEKAYGGQSNGAIPANSDLVFVVKLLNIKTQ